MEPQQQHTCCMQPGLHSGNCRALPQPVPCTQCQTATHLCCALATTAPPVCQAACCYGHGADRPDSLLATTSSKAGSLGHQHVPVLAAALASDLGLAQRLEGAEPPEDGAAAAARLAWGLLLAQSGPESAQRETKAEF